MMLLIGKGAEGEDYGSVDAFLAVLDKYRNLASAGGFEDFRELSYGLLQDLGRADVDFGDDYHDRDVEGEGDA